MKGHTVKEISTEKGKVATTHRVESVDADDVVFIAEGSEVTKVSIYKHYHSDRRTEVLETWVAREVWQELCHRLEPLRNVCDCDETPHERGSGMCVHPPETF